MTTRDKEERSIKEIEGIITGLIRAVVKNPAACKIEFTKIANILAFVVYPGEGDTSRVIGGRGKHISALKTIASELAKLIEYEAHVEVPDDGSRERRPAAVNRGFSFGEFNPERANAAVELLKRTIRPFLDNPDALEVKSATVATMLICEITVASADYENVYGKREFDFTYGRDGIIIGSIKNIFDGIGKNIGRTMRISLTTK